jgi:hypothetical protein
VTDRSEEQRQDRDERQAAAGGSGGGANHVDASRERSETVVPVQPPETTTSPRTRGACAREDGRSGGLRPGSAPQTSTVDGAARHAQVSRLIAWHVTAALTGSRVRGRSTVAGQRRNPTGLPLPMVFGVRLSAAAVAGDHLATQSERLRRSKGTCALPRRSRLSMTGWRRRPDGWSSLGRCGCTDRTLSDGPARAGGPFQLAPGAGARPAPRRPGDHDHRRPPHLRGHPRRWGLRPAGQPLPPPGGPPG